MGVAKSCLGLDIGSSQIKAVELERRGRGIRLRRAASTPTPPRSIRRGVVAHGENLAQALRQFQSQHRFAADHVILGFSSQDVAVKLTDLPAMAPKELRQALEFELGDILRLSFNSIDEISFSFAEVTRTNERLEVLVVGCRREIVEAYVQAARPAGLRPHAIDVNAFALPRLCSSSGRACFIDIGAEQTKIYVEADGGYKLYRILAVGGTNLTNGVMDAFDLSWEAAEDLRFTHNLDYLLQEGTGAESLLRSVVQQFVGGVLQTFDYLRARESRAVGSELAAILGDVYLCGGGALQSGLREVLRDEAETDIQLLNPFASLDIPEQVTVPHDSPAFAPAVGLALRGLTRDAH